MFYKIVIFRFYVSCINIILIDLISFINKFIHLFYFYYSFVYSVKFFSTKGSYWHEKDFERFHWMALDDINFVWECIRQCHETIEKIVNCHAEDLIIAGFQLTPQNLHKQKKLFFREKFKDFINLLKKKRGPRHRKICVTQRK